MTLDSTAGPCALAFVALAMSVLFCAQSEAQVPVRSEPGPRESAAPRIGLALSGGGARGIAHLGVLKALEELRVPIHCITGTSMGAIVGGTFAAGRTPREMEEMVLAADWNEIFRDAPPRKEIAVRRKIDDYKTLFAPEFGLRDGALLLPKGLIAGVSIESFFRELSTPAFGVTDFGKLPIPFRAMGTDIETGEAVVLQSGSLAQAMRASMSVPGAIAPVEIDGRLLVDGGIANNLPINEARKLCADVIIAVNISTPPLKRDELTSALSVSAQLVNFLGKQTVDEQLKSLGERDILIAPDLGDISAGTFERSKDAIRIGEEATRAVADKLKRYSLPPEQYAALRTRQVAEAKVLGTVDEIRVEGLKRTNPAVVRELVQSKPGEPLSEEKLGADLRRVYGTGDYEGITYRMVGGDTSPRAMLIEPVEKSWGGDYLRFGLGLASDFGGDSEFNLLVQYRRSWMNRLGGEWLTEVQIGQDSRLLTEFYQPLNESNRWFVSPYLGIGRQQRPVFIDDDKVAEYVADFRQIGLDVGKELGTWGRFRLGTLWSTVDAHVDTGPPLLPSIDEQSAGLRAVLFVDQVDHVNLPTKGFSGSATAYGAMKALGSSFNYQRLEGKARIAESWGKHTFTFEVSGGTDLDNDMPAYDAFVLGGPLRLSGYRVNQFTGNKYAFGRLLYYQRVKALPDLLGSGVYAGASAELARISDRAGGLPAPGSVWSSSVYLGADTFVGPLFFGLGLGGSGHWTVYLLLGRP